MTNDLFTRYLEGKCTPEETAFVEECLKDSKFTNQFMNREDWDNCSENTPLPQSAAILKKIHIRIQQSKKKKIKRILKRTSVAAAILLLLAVPFYFQMSIPPEKVTYVKVNKTTALPITNLVQINSSNQNMELICSDSSIITLYPNSEVRYAETFDGSTERNIYLKGTAKFQVTKNKEKPFRVISNGYTTTALGTTFIVNDSESSRTKIELLEGKIEIKSNFSSDTRPLKKEISYSGSVIINQADSRILHEVKPINQQNDRQSLFVEQEKHVVFKNLAIDDIIKILEQNYSLKIVYDSNKTQHKYFSGTFIKDSNTYQKVLNEINYLHKLNISYTK